MVLYTLYSFDELEISGSEVDCGLHRDIFSNNEDVKEMASNTAIPEPGCVGSNTSASLRLRLFPN